MLRLPSNILQAFSRIGQPLRIVGEPTSAPVVAQPVPTSPFVYWATPPRPAMLAAPKPLHRIRPMRPLAPTSAYDPEGGGDARLVLPEVPFSSAVRG